MLKTPILESIFSDEFQGTQSDSIFILSERDALSIWKTYVDINASSYFKLKDDNWVTQSEKQIIGNWLEDFNNNIQSNYIAKLLDSNTLWKDNEVVWFCISKFLIIEATWFEFKRLWYNFIECEDDCPIIINREKPKTAIIFTPIGDIIAVM